MAIARSLAVIYLGVTLGCSMLQEQLIFPGSGLTQGKPSARVEPSPGLEIISLTLADGTTCYGFLAGPANGGSLAGRPTVLFFYGNGMSMADCFGFVRSFRDMGCNLMVVDYPGYGMSGGKPSEQGCYAVADAAWSYLNSRPDIDASQRLIAGWSLGSAVAVDLAARRCQNPAGGPVPAGLMAFSAFTSMTDMARRTMPILPVSLILRHRFDSLSKIDDVTCPIYFAHGRDDSVIPFQMTMTLAAAAAQARAARGDAGAALEPLVVDSADHNDFFEVADRQLTDSLSEWIRNLPRK